MQRQVVELKVSAGDLLDIGALGNGLPATFSCNDSLEVWPYVTRGLTPLRDRVYLQGKSHVLDTLVLLVNAARPGGGRFTVSTVGVRLKADNSCIVDFRKIGYPFE